MKIKKASWLYLALAVVMLVSMFAGFTGADEEPCEPELEVDLIAGQNMVVGTVTVENDDEYLCVTYALDEEALADGWLIYETHLAIDTEYDGIPQTRGNRWGTNPIPGQFPYGDDELDGVEEWRYCISLEELDVDFSDDVFIAAHAVVKRADCEILAEAPYGGSSVVDYDQGLRYNYTAVREQRSNPNAALTFTTGSNEANFFSLGFQEDRDGDAYDDYRDNAWIIIEFDYPILNGPGDDLRIIEDTWGLPYPDETADVWVSQDGSSWEYLGEADNQNPYMSYHTITDFDLEGVGLDYAKYVKVQDTSNRADFDSRFPGQSATLDGFDLNAVVALQDYVKCEEFDETAWGEGERFNEKGNWGMWFKYQVCEPEPPCIPIDLIFGVKGNGELWEIDMSAGTEVFLETANNLSGNSSWPNGVAYDPENERLYYADGNNQKTIYFYDLGTGTTTEAGVAAGIVAGAEIAQGAYWYVENGTNKFKKVTLGDNGLVTGETLAATLGDSHNFGDLAIAPDGHTLYGHSNTSLGDALFTIDLIDDYAYSVIKSPMGLNLQIAFGADGKLYGVSGEPKWYEIDLTTGELELARDAFNSYTDLAHGVVCR